MPTSTLRLGALFAAILISLVVIDAAITLEPAHAAPESEADAFIMKSFPHETTAVNFWDSWGARRSGGRRHRGTDILSPRGTPVLAVADGTVAEFGKQRLSGYFIRLDHGDGWTTTYMHLNNDVEGDDGLGGLWTAIYPTLTVGAEVHAGDVIGYVGDSGNAEGTQPHIHFEVKHDGVKVNPYPFLKAVWDRERRGGSLGLEIR
jgi:peptidoglycan LD-endopeptidase LytH